MAICQNLQTIALEKDLKDFQYIKAVYLEKEDFPEMMVLQRSKLFKQYEAIMKEIYSSMEQMDIQYGFSRRRNSNPPNDWDPLNTVGLTNKPLKFTFFRVLFVVIILYGFAFYMIWSFYLG